MLVRLGFSLVLALTLPVFGNPLQGQVIEGSVREVGSDRPIRYAGITVFDTLGHRIAATATSLAGTYALELPTQGVFTLSVAAIGYSRESRGPLQVLDGQSMTVDLELEPAAVTLPGIRVEVERARLDKYLEGQGFYRRSRTAASGYFFSPEEIEDIDPLDLHDLVSRIPGFWYRETWRGSSLTCISHGGSNTPRVFVDGFRVRSNELDLVAPVRTIAAMEMYRGGASLPVEFSATGSSGQAACVVVIWTKT